MCQDCKRAYFRFILLSSHSASRISNNSGSSHDISIVNVGYDMQGASLEAAKYEAAKADRPETLALAVTNSYITSTSLFRCCEPLETI